MSIDTTVVEAPVAPQKLRYPRLQRHRSSHHLVFLFLSETVGIGLTSPYDAREVMTEMTPGLYEDFPGSISLSNLR